MRKLGSIYEKTWAKEKESLLEHTNSLLKNLDILKEYLYVDEKTYKLLEYAIYYHDSGKINPAFEKRLKSRARFDDSKEVGHNILSAYIASYFLNDDLKIDQEKDKKKREEKKAEKRLIVSAILEHHNYIPNFEYFKDQENRDLISKNLASISEKYFSKEIDFEKSLGYREISKMSHERESRQYIITKGLLNRCDYSASGHYDIELKNDFLEKSLDDLGYSLRDIQFFCKNNHDDNLIVVGSTGLGKTEASLLWNKNEKLFYILPLRTAINAMYKRISKIVKDDIDQRVGLLHGNTASEYLKEKEEKKEYKEKDQFFDYIDRTKNLSLPITVTTPDQIFDFVFKYPGYEAKLSTFSYSRIVIDEIQAYSPDILAYTILAIKKINSLGGKFAIFTATLAPFVKDLLYKEIEGEKRIAAKEAKFLSESKRHNIHVEEESISSDYIKEVLEKRKVKNALVVVNTVKKAQEIYQKLSEKLGEDYQVNLLHSRFIAKDRSEKEEEIMKDASENSDLDKIKVWVSTQIVEASLDIDFDILFTELSELLGLFQRMGRCYRKREIKENLPNVFIFTEIEDFHFIKDDKGFIDKGLYNVSKKALLCKKDGLLTEKEKDSMIEEHFSTEKLKKEQGFDFLDKYQKKVDMISKLNIDQMQYTDVKREFRNIISYKAIPESIYCKSEVSNIIEKIDKKIQEGKKQNKFELLKLKEELNQYSLNVGQRFISKAKEKKIAGEKIYILNKKYDKNLGLGDEEDNSGLII